MIISIQNRKKEWKKILCLYILDPSWMVMPLNSLEYIVFFLFVSDRRYIYINHIFLNNSFLYVYINLFHFTIIDRHQHLHFFTFLNVNFNVKIHKVPLNIFMYFNIEINILD